MNGTRQEYTYLPFDCAMIVQVVVASSCTIYNSHVLEDTEICMNLFYNYSSSMRYKITMITPISHNNNGEFRIKWWCCLLLSCFNHNLQHKNNNAWWNQKRTLVPYLSAVAIIIWHNCILTHCWFTHCIMLIWSHHFTYSGATVALPCNYEQHKSMHSIVLCVHV